MAGFQNHRSNLSKLPWSDPFQIIDPMVQGNTEVLVNVSALCHMDLQSTSIASNFDGEEDDDDEIWQRDDGERSILCFSKLYG